MKKLKQPARFVSVARRWPLLLAGMLFFAACRKQDGDTDLITKDVNVSAFRTINIKGVYNVYLVQDTLYSVSMTGFRRVLDYSDAVVNDGILELTSEPKGAYLHPGDPTPEIYIHVDTLERINIMEGCHVRTMNALTGIEIGIVVDTKRSSADLELNCGTFYYWNNPNGFTLTLRGQVQNLKVWNSGLGAVDASLLYSSYVQTINGGLGDCKVRAADRLEYGLTSGGNIYYYGSPPNLVPLEVNAGGQLIKAD